MGQLNIPEENIEIYGYIYCIEVALRELTIELFTELDGPKWYKQRLPGDILDKFRAGFAYEKNVKWTQLIPHHPVYYIDFTDLKKIIESKKNWTDAYKNLFMRKDVITSTLSEIESIRNRIAHNRKASNKDVDVVKGAYTKISEAISKNKFEKLTMKCTFAKDIFQLLKELKKEFESSFITARKLNKLNRDGIWESISNQWWFDETYLGCNLEGIINFFEKIHIYEKLPRKRGSGHNIEKWIKNSELDLIYKNARKQFEKILEKWEG